jgi:hypothetical protein
MTQSLSRMKRDSTMNQQDPSFEPLAPAVSGSLGSVALVTEEVLVADSRGGETPAQVVERKLVMLMQGKQVPISHLQTRRLRGPSA